MNDTPETDAAYTQRPNEGTWDFRVRQEKTMESLERERNQWKAEAERWRDMYMQFDEMLESDIKDATEKVSDIIAQVEKLSKEMDKGY
jgi:hypothetical protein